MELWPGAVRQAVKTGPDREVLAVYPTHSAVPREVWRHLIADADRSIMLCGYAPYWLSWQVPDLAGLLGRKAAAGTTVRIVIGDPDTPLVVADEAATGGPLTLTARIQQAEHLFAPLVEQGVQLRRSAMGFGRSVYIGDHVAVADWWLHGHRGDDFPVLHLQRRMDGGMFDGLAAHTEALWQAAQPV
jgi:hypothetical protein